MIFAQGDEADAVFYVQKGKVRLTVVSKIGKEATIAIVSQGNFFGKVRWQVSFCGWAQRLPCRIARFFGWKRRR